MTFQLDTSGEVRGARLIEQPDGNWRSHWAWSDLDAFTQGYIGALFAEWQGESEAEGFYGFRHLAPSTLAAILRDCAQVARILGNRFGDGASFWVSRQQGKQANFPPLAVTLGDDGKVWLQ